MTIYVKICQDNDTVIYSVLACYLYYIYELVLYSA